MRNDDRCVPSGYEETKLNRFGLSERGMWMKKWTYIVEPTTVLEYGVRLNGCRKKSWRRDG